MKRLKLLFASSIGKKFVAAITGLIMFGFLVGHAAGHMKIFTGADANGIPHIDHYGQFLKDFGAPALPPMLALWGARLFLLGAVVLHIVTVILLSDQNKKARPVGYVKKKRAAASPAALYMMVTGSLILAFIVLHILHFTTGSLPLLGDHEHGAVYANMMNSFSNPLVSFTYIFMMVIIGFHLYHGVWSLFQTLGLDNPDRNTALRAFAILFAVGVSATFILIPVVFMFGMMPEAAEYSHELLSKH
jgi:succinate dehydrogenase / fumarate reductase cytochrome b subunit